MIVLSLFDGISCGRVALERARIPITDYYASEIDQYAIKIAMKNYPDTIQLGNINEWINWDIEKPELIIGGSPCQGFSFAGKQLAFNDPRSALFWKYVEILRCYKPKYFLLENVRMRKEHLQIITDTLEVEPVCINSALVSAQNRVRYYWTNIPNITQPEDKGILLKDIVDLGNLALHGTYTDGLADNIKGYENRRRVRQLNQKSNSLLAASGGHSEPKIDINNVNDNSRVKIITENDRGYRPHRGDVKSTGISELGRICKSDSKTDAITTNHAPKMALNKDINNLFYRKLTPVECERLQTLPDNYTEGVSNTQRYKMLGNGWTVDILAHIFSFMKNSLQI